MINKKLRVAISIGDLNGVGLELALKTHDEVKKIVEPIYLIGDKMLEQGAKLLKFNVPKDFNNLTISEENFEIQPGKTSSASGKYSFHSFLKAIELAKNKDVDAIVTLPINKEAWSLAGIDFKGHTDALRNIFKQDAIMFMGVTNFFIALFTEHIPYSEVPKYLTFEKFTKFLLELYPNIPKNEQVAVLGLNPHAGDNGVLGNEEEIIKEAVNFVNKKIRENIFSQPLVPDVAFIPAIRNKFKYYVAIYHDQGLIPLKTLFFDEVINVSLNLPIIRVSVGHGTAFDKAYKNSELSDKSYLQTFVYLNEIRKNML